jgi:hypothetical protein
MLAAGFVLAAVALLLLAGATTPARAAHDLASDGVSTVVVRDGAGDGTSAGHKVTATARRDDASTGVRGALTPPPSDAELHPGPAHRLLPGWGWVVLGLICFAVVLGLAWPDHRDRG